MGSIKKMINSNNLCIQCGICAAICPKKCIELEKKGHNYLPKVNNECINCGLCNKVCPMQNLCDNYNPEADFSKSILGEYKQILSVKIKDKVMLKNSASGGIVTQTVKYLLDNNIYNKAFLLEGYSYENQMETRPFDKNSDLTMTAKSRYLTISHKNTCEYIKNNPNEKVVIVGTGCAINGIKNFIDVLRLNRDNYLFIGLICDKTMNYGVYEYFKGFCPDENLKKLYFRTKENGGWPGNVRLEFENGDIMDLSKKERMAVKEYFMPECCLYCLNKLNSNADIVCGDNYIKRLEDLEGRSSVIIRTDKGLDVIKSIEPLIETVDSTEEEFLISVATKDKVINVENAKIKGLLEGKAKKESYKRYKNSLRKIKVGAVRSPYKAVQKDLVKQKFKLKNLPNLIFSIKNEYEGGIKYKYLTLLGKRFLISQKKKN